MRHEQVVPDYIVMLESSITVLALVGCGWLLFKLVWLSLKSKVWSISKPASKLHIFVLFHRLVSACIWFPQYMKNLQVEADKANAHLEKTLLPKDSITDDENEAIENKGEGKSEDEDDRSKAEDTPEPPLDTPAEGEEPKKDK